MRKLQAPLLLASALLLARCAVADVRTGYIERVYSRVAGKQTQVVDEEHIWFDANHTRVEVWQDGTLTSYRIYSDAGMASYYPRAKWMTVDVAYRGYWYPFTGALKSEAKSAMHGKPQAVLLNGRRVQRYHWSQPEKWNRHGDVVDHQAAGSFTTWIGSYEGLPILMQKGNRDSPSYAVRNLRLNIDLPKGIFQWPRDVYAVVRPHLPKGQFLLEITEEKKYSDQDEILVDIYTYRREADHLLRTTFDAAYINGKVDRSYLNDDKVYGGESILENYTVFEGSFYRDIGREKLTLGEARVYEPIGGSDQAWKVWLTAFPEWGTLVMRRERTQKIGHYVQGKLVDRTLHEVQRITKLEVVH